MIILVPSLGGENNPCDFRSKLMTGKVRLIFFSSDWEGKGCWHVGEMVFRRARKGGENKQEKKRGGRVQE